MKKWIEPPPVTVPESLASLVGGHPLVGATLARRGILDPQTARSFLDHGSYSPASPSELPGLDSAVARLESAIEENESLWVWGDFDVDGQTSTTLLVQALKELGANVNFHIPVRANESHGVNLPVLGEIIDQGAQLVLTCDTGIAAHEAVAYAQGRGVQVIVTDHHDLPPSLPGAYAIVNPKLLPEGHPLSTLPGVGVAFKLVEALFQRAGREAELERYLDLVALGIVADIALQVGDTRYLLQRGLQVLQENQRLGLKVLMEMADLNPTWLTEEHIGFILAPRMNALGRLGDANSIVEFLTTEDIARARTLALELETLNARRKLLTDQVFQGAQAQLERDPSLNRQVALVLAHPSWPAGVIGIVASRLVERYNKPTILISAPPGEVARGSARSVEGVNITAAIVAQKDMLEGFGGHPMAAGLSIDPERILEFRTGLARTINKMLGEVPLETRLQVDGYLGLSELSLDLVADLERLAPFGAGNPSLVLVSQKLRLVNYRPLGRNAEHLLLTVEDSEGLAQKVIWWGGAGWPLPEGEFDLAYNVRASTFQGQRQVQLEWVDARILEDSLAERQPARPAIEVVDYRREAHPLPILMKLQAEGDVQVWCEAEAKDKLDGNGRDELEPAGALAIWTIPPGPVELQHAINAVKPEKVYLFAVDPGMDDPGVFLKRLTGLVKFGLKAKNGRTRLESLARATSQREAVVRLGLKWLQARGYILIISDEDDELLLDFGDDEPKEDLAWITDQLRTFLGETTAYRSYFTHADAHNLLNIPVDDDHN